MSGVADIRIAGVPEWDASEYSVAEDSTPLTPGDMTGGTGQFTFAMPMRPGGKRIRGKEVFLEDGDQGTTRGTISGIGGDDFTVNVTVDSRLAALTATRTAQPRSGTLESVMRYYLGLVGLTTGIVIDAAVANIPVVTIGWNGVVWDYVKQLCTAHSFEVSLVSNNVVVRPARTREAINGRDTAVSWDIDDTNVAQGVEITYSVPSVTTGKALAYPLGGWSDEFQPIQVDVNETVEQTFSLIPSGDELGLGASLTAIDQPTAADHVVREHQSSSVYCVVGNDGYPIKASEWTAAGGSVKVEIGEDTQSLKVTVVGAGIADRAPFRIAAPSGPSDYYSSLRIVGTGVFYEKKLLALSTGLSEARAPEKIGERVDIPFITSKEMAFRRGAWLLSKWHGLNYTISVSTSGIHREGESGSYAYPTIREFNAQYPGSIRQFNTIWAGKTIADYNQWWKDQYADDFANQAFGNVGGARTEYDGNVFRIRSVGSITPAGVSYAASLDTTVADFNRRYAGLSIRDFNALHAGMTIADSNVSLLRPR